MAKPIPVALESSLVAVQDAPTQFAGATRDGTIQISGHLSTGRRGWRLRATATCHRLVVRVQVTAEEVPPGGTPDLEYYCYSAVLKVDRPGCYRVRVTHAYRLVGEVGSTLLDPVYDQKLTVL